MTTTKCYALMCYWSYDDGASLVALLDDPEQARVVDLYRRFLTKRQFESVTSVSLTRAPYDLFWVTLERKRTPLQADVSFEVEPVEFLDLRA